MLNPFASYIPESFFGGDPEIPMVSIDSDDFEQQSELIEFLLGKYSDEKEKETVRNIFIQ